ncbi:hypothetical protein M141_2803 [Bacteroides fragilis str. S38L5]|nr:hypothetical protein M141_2803 [Bacteroides fragilis str. S38L5]
MRHPVVRHVMSHGLYPFRMFHTEQCISRCLTGEGYFHFWIYNHSGKKILL